jgi:hypothetical protein
MNAEALRRRGLLLSLRLRVPAFNQYLVAIFKFGLLIHHLRDEYRSCNAFRNATNFSSRTNNSSLLNGFIK